MKAYRHSVNLKVGMIVFAVLIAVASLLYTERLVERLREREQFLIRLWSRATEQLSGVQHVNPYAQELADLQEALEAPRPATPEETARYREAVAWARAMPPAGEVTLATEILTESNFGIPAIVTDSSQRVFIDWKNVPVEAPPLSNLSPEDSARAIRRLNHLIGVMRQANEPLLIQQDFGPARLKLYVFYDASHLIRELRLFPYIQLAFVSLFILIGYFGLAYVRRSEQRGLWVGMAKEAAHQLGTPISSLMGWVELLGLEERPSETVQMAVGEISKDVDRLRRVTSRFSDIGSLPKLEPMRLAPVVGATADYMHRRFPQQGNRVALHVDVPEDLAAPLNAELFEWVVENLIKNALDAMEGAAGRIDISAHLLEDRVYVDVRDTGKGIDRQQWRNVFRPGYSTKKRGWGLGLSLAKRIVEDYHGGKLYVAASRLGHGTTFRIELPAWNEPPSGASPLLNPTDR